MTALQLLLSNSVNSLRHDATRGPARIAFPATRRGTTCCLCEHFLTYTQPEVFLGFPSCPKSFVSDKAQFGQTRLESVTIHEHAVRCLTVLATDMPVTGYGPTEGSKTHSHARRRPRMTETNAHSRFLRDDLCQGGDITALPDRVKQQGIHSRLHTGLPVNALGVPFHCLSVLVPVRV